MATEFDFDELKTLGGYNILYVREYFTTKYGCDPDLLDKADGPNGVITRITRTRFRGDVYDLYALVKIGYQEDERRLMRVWKYQL